MRKTRANVNYALLKMLVIVLILCLLTPLSMIKCHAQENVDEVKTDFGLEDAIDDFYDIIPDDTVDIKDASDISNTLGVKRILRDIIDVIKGNSDKVVSFLLMLIGIGMMCALASLGDGELSSSASRAVGVVASALLFERIVYLVDSAVKSISEINSFFAALIPVVLTVNSLGASPTVAATQAVGMGFTLSVYSFISEKLLESICVAIFITSAISFLAPLTMRLAKSVRCAFLSAVSMLTVLVGATFTLQSVISVSADSVAVRSARYAVSNSIPIVGNVVSGALNLVAGGVSYARSIVGGGGIAVLLTLMLSPLVTMLCYRLSLKLGGIFCSLASIDYAHGIIESFIGALDSLLAVYSLTCVIYAVELVAFLKGGVSLA